VKLLAPAKGSDYLTRAKAAGLSGEVLEGLLFPHHAAAGWQIPLPDWIKVHKELRRKSVTLSLLWVEYCQAHTVGYGYSQFCHRYGAEVDL
jgi:transposase